MKSDIDSEFHFQLPFPLYFNPAYIKAFCDLIEKTDEIPQLTDLRIPFFS